MEVSLSILIGKVVGFAALVLAAMAANGCTGARSTNRDGSGDAGVVAFDADSRAPGADSRAPDGASPLAPVVTAGSAGPITISAEMAGLEVQRSPFRLIFRDGKK